MLRNTLKECPNLNLIYPTIAFCPYWPCLAVWNVCPGGIVEQLSSPLLAASVRGDLVEYRVFSVLTEFVAMVLMNASTLLRHASHQPPGSRSIDTGWQHRWFCTLAYKCGSCCHIVIAARIPIDTEWRHR